LQQCINLRILQIGQLFLGPHVSNNYVDVDICRTFYEATGKFPSDGKEMVVTVNNEDLLAMHNCSPIAHVNKVKTPYLLLIGEKDLRVVPHYNGYIRCLQAKGVPCK
jgi:dipeptidyl aminopeptidase/acylaminoacyl peptidase